MFLWRKITIIEGNYFILEKRVDMFKKTEREHLISKNIEKADIVMNEIFKDSINKKGGYCNNLNYCPSDGKTQKQSVNQSASITEQESDISKYINIINTPDVPNDIKNKIEIKITKLKNERGRSQGETKHTTRVFVKRTMKKLTLRRRCNQEP